MQEINFKQDFPLLESFYYKNEKGDLESFGFPPFNFVIRYWTTSQTASYDASCTYVHGEPRYKNCKRSGDKLLVVFDRHRLMPGELKAEMKMYVPDDLYPDGIRTDRITLYTGVRLVQGPTRSPSLVESMAILPYIKGKDGKTFTYEDLTEEQIEDFAGKVAEKVIDDNIGTKIDEAIEKKLNEEFKLMEDIPNEEFVEMFED